jgi:hypothetical protein
MLNKIYIYIIIIIIIILIKYLYNKCITFQHNYFTLINKNTYTYVYEYKKQLLQNITNLLNELQIRFVIAHGNLIEYERQKSIYHDDDLDIRFCENDMWKWAKYCNENNFKEHNKYNLAFDNRISYIDKQKINGIQIQLIKFINTNNIKTYPKLEIHADLVAANIKTSIWIVYDIDFNNLRKIIYLDIATYAPNKENTIKILTKEYGKKYLIPNRTYFNFLKLN